MPLSSRIFALLAAVVLLPVVLSAADMESARHLLESGDVPGARAAYAELAKAPTTSGEAHYWLGVIALRTADVDTAIDELQAACDADPKEARYQTELGGAYGEAARHASIFRAPGLAKKCRLALEKGIELDPKSIGARMALIQFLRQAPSIVGGGIDKALAQAEEIRKLSPLRGAMAAADLDVAKKDFAAAVAECDGVLANEPDNYVALYMLGLVAGETDDYRDRGEKALRRCLELEPGPRMASHSVVWFRLGEIATRHGDKAAAKAAYEKALELDPKNTAAADALKKP